MQKQAFMQSRQQCQSEIHAKAKIQAKADIHAKAEIQAKPPSVPGRDSCESRDPHQLLAQTKPRKKETLDEPIKDERRRVTSQKRRCVIAASTCCHSRTVEAREKRFVTSDFYWVQAYSLQV